MQPFQDIAVGLTLDLDGIRPTRAAERAVEQARRLARVPHQEGAARVTLVHSTWDDQQRSNVAGGPLLGPPAPPDVALAAQPLLDRLRGDGVETELELTDDRPWLALARRAASGRHDLVLVAARDRPTPGGTPLGTTTKQLLRTCPCPVWVVHPTHELLRRAVLAATDLSPVGMRAVRLAHGLAAATGAELHVVHALGLASPRELERGVEHKRKLFELALRREADARADIAAALLDVPDAKPRIHVGAGPARDEILACAGEVDPDLLVLGTVSRTGVPGYLIGNTAEALVDRLEGSLLAVKPEGFRSPVDDASS